MKHVFWGQKKWSSNRICLFSLHFAQHFHSWFCSTNLSDGEEHLGFLFQLHRLSIFSNKNCKQKVYCDSRRFTCTHFLCKRSFPNIILRYFFVTFFQSLTKPEKQSRTVMSSIAVETVGRAYVWGESGSVETRSRFLTPIIPMLET